jgi:predicted transcriptional regulator of viral defense system
MKTADFFATYPVFSLDEATRLLEPPGGRAGAVSRLKHHLRSGRLVLAARGVYAVVPAGLQAGRFQPDPYLVAAAARPDAVFCYHSALELLGVAHSVWSGCTVFTARRRRPASLPGAEVHFLEDPQPLRTLARRDLGTATVEHHGRVLRVTGPERTLVEGLRRPRPAGGLEELLDSASAFPTLDLDLLEAVLSAYGTAHLWAAAGWFLERFAPTFHVPATALESFARRRPRSAQYLERDRRGGTLLPRWNLIVPDAVIAAGEPDDR